MDTPSKPPPHGHRHCDAGLFHSELPIHTHRHCKNCFRMNRCEGAEAFKLFRCSKCAIETYCSKECQKEHWKKGHKGGCQFYSLSREATTRNSGDPKAWSYLTTWIAFHNTTLVNATLAFYLLQKDIIPDVAATHLLHLSLLYHDDPALPIERRFEVRGFNFTHKDKPAIAPGKTYADIVYPSRKGAVQMGHMSLGDDYWDTGAYLLMVQFKKENQGAIPFWKHFGIDKASARATPSCHHPADILKYHIHGGLKPHFCCGRMPGMPTCCCGGWTHEKSGHAPKEGW